jgi:predicted nucleic acid-binding protein
MILIDSNIIFDIIDNDLQWRPWSTGQLRSYANIETLAINAIVYAEISPRYLASRSVDELVESLKLSYMQIPRAAAFLAGKAFAEYRRKGGTRSNVLADFFIGAHATVLGCAILTRDIRRYSTYFPNVRLISP